MARAQQELTLSVLRTDAAALRQFLQQAGSALGFIRVTLRQPARTQQALRDKLVLLRDEAQSLHGRAARLTLLGVAEPALALAAALEELLARDTSSGDDLLPLALRIDSVATGLSALASVDEQRAPVSPGPAAVASRPSARTTSDWHEVCEQRFNEFVQRRGSEVGVIARLRMKGSALVPERYHRQVESALEPLIDNALRHGIESPESRLVADKPAAGTITVTFRSQHGGLEMSVHDDGRGFNVEGLRDTALVHGLVDEAQAAALGPRELVGLIFRPGMAHAMSLLRESLQRLGGNVSVATKPLRYTQFNLRFPDTGAVARSRPSRQALP
jgi:hypothetical protein